MKRTGLANLALILSLLLLAMSAVGCADEEKDFPTAGGPAVVELNKNELVVGETLLFFGQGFRTGGEDGVTRLTFTGEYVAEDGSSAEVNFDVTPLYDGTWQKDDASPELDVLRWSRFGPFEVPFGMSATGVFRGQIHATNIEPNGDMVQGASTRTFEVNVAPSLVIEKLQPVIAECGDPAIRGLGAMPYDMTVRAVGFTPTRFVYTIQNINNVDQPTIIEHTASGPTDKLGESEPFVLNPVPEDKSFYVTRIHVEAFDKNGQSVETVLPFSVHRPLEFFSDGKEEVAQYFEPEAVTGCIPGGINTNVTYSETKSETRQRSLSISVSRNWNRSNSNSESSGWSEGFSETNNVSTTSVESASLSESQNVAENYNVSHNSSSSNNVGFSSTDGENWNWNVSEGVTSEESLQRAETLTGQVGLSTTTTVGGEGSVPGLAKVSGSVAVQGSVQVGTSNGVTTGTRQGVRQDRGYASGGNNSETQTFGSVTSDSVGTSTGGSFSLSSNSSQSRSYSDTQARSESRTYNLSGSTGTQNTVSEGINEAEQQTWSESSTDSTLLGFSDRIINGQFGVFYRQTVRLSTKGYIRSYNLCGVSEVQSEMTFNDWKWAPALATSSECGQQLPEPNLPAAQCFIEPCE